MIALATVLLLQAAPAAAGQGEPEYFEQHVDYSAWATAVRPQP